MLDNNNPAKIRAYIDAAEHYFRVLERPETLFNKPWVPVSEAPFALARLSGMLHHLRLWPNNVVLDFGAGMCWLSGILARMGCRPIALDVSESALRLGARALGDLPTLPSAPQIEFKVFDGFTMDLPDQSVDRVACFDALHHVPNKARVLSEMYRVLRPGGRVCFAEPSPGHAHAEESVRESQTYGVLEDEVDPVLLCRMAQVIGFTDSYVVPIGEPGSVVWSADSDAVAEGRAAQATYPVREVLIVLLKEPEGADSRAPSRLAAKVELVTPTTPVAPGAEFAARVRVSNLGDTLWLALPEAPPGAGAEPLDYGAAFLQKHIVVGDFVNRESVECYRRYIEINSFQGMVTVGARLQGLNGSVIDRDYARGFLDRDIPAGGQADVTVRMVAPVTPGLYGVVFDLVNEYVGWFEDAGSRVVRDYLRVEGSACPPDSRSPGLLQCRVTTEPLPTARHIVVDVTNTGDTLWLMGPLAVPGEVMLGIQVIRPGGELLTRDWRRVLLPRCVAPGEVVSIAVDLSHEIDQDVRHIRLDMVAEGLCWFEHAGSIPLDLDLSAV